MNAEDLKKLKEELEKQKKFVIVPVICNSGFKNAGEPMLSNEILSQEKTDEVAKQCESLIEKAVRYLTTNDIPFDQLTISSNMGLICRQDYFEELKKGAAEEWDAIMKKIDTKILPKIVPVSFFINEIATGTEDWDIDSFIIEKGLSYPDLFKEKVSGIVNWEKFVIQMKALGYNINFLNYGDKASFDDYVETVKQNGFDTEIDVNIDFGRTKNSTSPKM